MPNPIIPEYITVHLGDPDQPARNITVPFIEYIKNVASSEIYPTWPESALRANILAQISYALNRIYTEWYRSKGYDFDITSSTRYDQKFIENREYFENISRIVDEVFDDYIVRQGNIEPLFAQYCNGTTVTCPGLSQWGTVDLANQGMVPYEILQYYYGNDINIVQNAPLQENVESYPGAPLRLGSGGEDVRIIQRQLNRISDNYPAIPKISETNGVFNTETEAAVRKFQEIFNLTVDGIVGKATWYKIKFIYNNVKRLSELSSEGISITEAQRIYPENLKQGDTGDEVGVLQYYLSVIGFFDDEIPIIAIDNVFGPNTTNAVIAFQQKYGLNPTGEIDRNTWNKILSVYDSTISTLPSEYLSVSDEIYPGRLLSKGMTGDDVRTLQQFLQRASLKYDYIPNIEVTGTFDQATEDAVRAVQNNNNISINNGSVGPLTWSTIVNLSK